MAFTTCERCGCKAIVAGMCVCIAYATIHSDPLCFGARPDRAVALYCTKVAAEPVHGPHHDQPSMPEGPTGPVITVVSSTGPTGPAGPWAGGQR